MNRIFNVRGSNVAIYIFVNLSVFLLFIKAIFGIKMQLAMLSAALKMQVSFNKSASTHLGI